MTPRLLALTITAAFALGAAGTASAMPILDPFLGNVVGAPTSGTWDTTHSYAVNGKARTCTLTRGAKCVGANLRGRVKHHGDLRKANLRRADLRFADLRGANLAGADLRSANLKHADLRGASIKGAKFQYTPPVHGKKPKRDSGNASTRDSGNAYEGANLAGVDLADTNLVEVNFTGANLEGAILAGSNLTRANLTRTDLSRASLYSASLSGANLTGANLSGAILTHAWLSGVVWAGTTCPDGVVTSTGCDATNTPVQGIIPVQGSPRPEGTVAFG